MGSNNPTATDLIQIRTVADKVLGDETFQRSPVMSRLLDYLVDMTTRGQAIKSYTIAIDGLGRSDRNLSEADTYARVAVARLRKTLSVYYAANPQGEEIYIDTGSYEVRLRSNGKAQVLEELPSTIPAGRRWRIPDTAYGKTFVVLFVCLILALAGITYYRSATRQEQVWTTFNLPTVEVVAVRQDEIGEASSDEIEIHRQVMMMTLGGYVGLRVIDEHHAPPDFYVRIFLSSENSGTEEIVSLVENKSGRVLWSNSYAVGSTEAMHQSAVDAASEIGSPAGIIHSFARRSGYDTQTPYGCWLRFTEGVQTYNTLGDEALADCAEDWYTAAKNRPLAAFLYGWTLIDKSVFQLTSDSRNATIRQALDILHRSEALNPDVAVLYIAEMRAYSFLGDRRRALEAAGEALAKAKHNRLIIGMAASSMALWNDPRGEAILQQLHANKKSPFPWEHVGLFVAAMMREDVAEASKHLSHLDNFESGQPLLLLLKAAFSARTGREQEAAKALAELNANLRIRIAGTDQVIARLPMAPEVKARLKMWLSGTVPRAIGSEGSILSHGRQR